MEEKDLLISLSEIEKNLQSLKSAKILVEDTVGAYLDVRSDINLLLGEFTEVTASLKSLIISIVSENNKITEEIHGSIEIANNQLNVLNNTFSSQCNSIVLNFVDSIKDAIGRLKKETQALILDYKANNNDLKSKIEGLSKIQDSLIKAIEHVVSLKTDLADLQKQLHSSQKEQDKTLEKIALDLEKTGKTHAQVLTQIANDLKTSQDAQDEDLAKIKEAISTNASKLNSIISKTETIAVSISEKSSSVESKITDVSSACKTNKILIILNIIIAISALVIVIIK